MIETHANHDDDFRQESGRLIAASVDAEAETALEDLVKSTLPSKRADEFYEWLACNLADVLLDVLRDRKTAPYDYFAARSVLRTAAEEWATRRAVL